MRRPLDRSDLFGILLGLALVALLIRASARGEDPRAVAAAAVPALFLGNWLLALVHEIGHAVTAVALTGQRVLIQNGHERSLIRFSVGRIDFRLDPRRGRAYCQASPAAVTPRQWVAVCLAGPLASLAAAGVALALMPVTDSGLAFWALFVAALIATVHFVYNLVPLRHAGAAGTDGWQAVAALRLRGTPAWHEPMRPRGADRALVVALKDRFSRVGVGVVTVAHQEAQARGEATATTGHLLLGLALASGTAGFLSAAGVTRDAVREALDDHRSELADGAAAGGPSRLAGVALRIAVDSLSLRGESHVGPEHILYGVLRQTGGDGCAILRSNGADPDMLREALVVAMKPPGP